MASFRLTNVKIIILNHMPDTLQDNVSLMLDFIRQKLQENKN